MKGKTILSLAIVLSMMLAILPLATTRASPGNTVEVRFENGLNEIEKTPCSNFIVTIYISLDPQVTIDFWDMEIHWDPAVLELQNGIIADVQQGAFMSSFGQTVFACMAPNNGAGILPDIACGFMPGNGPAQGAGVLCTIKFHCKAPGDGNIIIFSPVPPGLESYLLMGPALVNIDVAIDGLVHQPAPPTTPPLAVITSPLDNELVPVCNDVILDGHNSVDGIDTLPPPFENCPIQQWIWDVDFHNGTVIHLYGDLTSFHCDGPGLVTITLTVIAPDPTPEPGNPSGYVDHDSETIDIMQVAPSIGPAIDVYTARGGEGALGTYPFGWSDAYGPQEQVCVFAKVTYNDEPVEYKPVAFEVMDKNGNLRDIRVAFSGPDGIATACFRIPWEGSGAEALFGNWSIVGVVDVAGTIVTDTVKFKFGYILSIRDIVVTGSPLHKGDTMTIDVDIKSISMTSHDAYVTVVACDEVGVPIGLDTAIFTVDPEDGISMGYTITIPSWAFVGTGTIYVNLFTAEPAMGGVPYCPERTAIFIILKTP